MDVGPDQHQALRHAERKAQTYGRALVVGLASLLCLSVCGSLTSSALTVLVFKESRSRGAIQPAVLSDSKPAVGIGLTPYGTGPTGMTVTPFEVPNNLDVGWDLEREGHNHALEAGAHGCGRLRPVVWHY